MSGQHLLDSKIKLSTCRRCEAYVFACDVSGLRVMADPGPIGLDAVRGCLMASVDVYRLHSVAGKPDHMQLATVAQLGVTGAEWLQAHNCGTKSINSKRVEPVEVAPPPSPCALLSRKRGVAPDSCPRRGMAEGDPGPVSCTLCDAVPF